MRLFRLLALAALALLAACAPAAPAQPPAAAGSSPAGYARPELLAETDWLAQHLDDADVRIVDMRPADAYRAGHVKNAVNFTSEKLKDPQNPLYVSTPEQIAQHMGALGIAENTLVVAYDAQGGLSAARLWWVLDYYGHTRFKLVNGGWSKWTKEGRPATTETPAVAPARFTPKVNPAVWCSVQDVKAAIDKPDFVIVDARTAAEYAGTDVRAKRGGRIPSAVNVDWQRNLTAEDPKVFRPAGELLKMYESAGVTRDKRIIAHCQTAVRSSHTLFTLRLLGYEMLQNYDGSWAEWGNDESLPVAR